MEARRELSEVGSFVLPLHGFWKSNSGCQVGTASSFMHGVISLVPGIAFSIENFQTGNLPCQYPIVYLSKTGAAGVHAFCVPHGTKLTGCLQRVDASGINTRDQMI